MKKMNKKEIEEITEKLKPYWKQYWGLWGEHFKNVKKLEKRMNNGIKSKVKLAFFYVDGEVVGIGADDYSDRKKFPLIDESEFW